MKTLVVGAGAVGGYIGVELVRAGRSVSFLVRETARKRVQNSGIEIAHASGEVTRTPVAAFTAAELCEPFDMVIVAVRSDAVTAALDAIAPSVTDRSVVIPVINGVRHIEALTNRFGSDRVFGGVAQLAVSLDNGVIREVRPGAALQVGPLGSVDDERMAAVIDELHAGQLVTTGSAHIVDAMWSKFAFITASATVTCLLRQLIGPIAHTAEGRATAEAVIAEVCAVAATAGHALGGEPRRALAAALTDPGSTFAPSMFRDLTSGRPVEAAVLAEMVAIADDQGTATPLVGAALAAAVVHNVGIAQ